MGNMRRGGLVVAMAGLALGVARGQPAALRAPEAPQYEEHNGRLYLVTKERRGHEEIVRYFDGQTDDACWDAAHRGYKTYGRIAQELGLTWGGGFGDSVHVQMRQEHSPARLFGWAAIDAEMRRRFESQAA